jgi:hypothetical protein
MGSGGLLRRRMLPELTRDGGRAGAEGLASSMPTITVASLLPSSYFGLVDMSERPPLSTGDGAHRSPRSGVGMRDSGQPSVARQPSGELGTPHDVPAALR